MQAEGEVKSEYLRVYSFNLDAEQGKVTVAGNVDPNTCIAMVLKGRESSAQQSSSNPYKLTMEKVPNVGNLKRVEKIKRARNNGNNINNCYRRLKVYLKDMKLPQFKDLKLPTKTQKSV